MTLDGSDNGGGVVLGNPTATMALYGVAFNRNNNSAAAGGALSLKDGATVEEARYDLLKPLWLETTHLHWKLTKSHRFLPKSRQPSYLYGKFC